MECYARIVKSWLLCFSFLFWKSPTCHLEQITHDTQTNTKKQTKKNTDTFLQQREKQLQNEKERTQCKNLKLKNNNNNNNDDEGHNGGKTTFSC